LECGEGRGNGCAEEEREESFIVDRRLETGLAVRLKGQ